MFDGCAIAVSGVASILSVAALGATVHYEALYGELRRIDVHLSAWWITASGVVAAAAPVRSYRLQHENSEDAGCGCSLCLEYRLRRAEVERLQPFIPDGHRWINCTCTVCGIMRPLQMGLMAVANKRDLWIEMSYHAWKDKAYRPRAVEVMQFIQQEIENPAYRRGWWSHDGGCVSMEFWLRKVDKALGVSRERPSA